MDRRAWEVISIIAHRNLSHEDRDVRTMAIWILDQEPHDPQAEARQEQAELPHPG